MPVHAQNGRARLPRAPRAAAWGLLLALLGTLLGASFAEAEPVRKPARDKGPRRQVAQTAESPPPPPAAEAPPKPVPAADDAEAIARAERAALEEAVEQIGRPELRARGLATLEQLGASPRVSREARRARARGLSWEPTRLDDAISAYDILLAEADGEEALALEGERAQVLSWAGRSAEAEAGYRRVLTARPDEVEALLGLARTLRWSGRAGAGREVAAQALRLAPARKDVALELAWGVLALGRGHASEAERLAAEGGGELDPEFRARLDELRRPTFSMASAAGGNAARLLRIAPRVRATLVLPRDFSLDLVGGTTLLWQGEARTAYATAGARLAASRDDLQGWLGFAGDVGGPTIQYDALAGASYRPWDAFSISLAVRHRPLLEPTEPFATDERLFYTAGPAASLLDRAVRMDVNELALSLGLSPTEWSYAYATTTGLAVTDANRGVVNASGAGANLLAPLGSLPVLLYLRWDLYALAWARESPVYYSPPPTAQHSAGLELRVRLSALELAANGGGQVPDVSGWFAGGVVNLETPHVVVAVRGEYRSSVWDRSWRGWLMLDVRP